MIFSFNLFGADNTPVPYDTDEIPEVITDIRRFEVITLGSLPFVALDTSLVYSSIKYVKGDSNKFPNPFSSSEDNGYTVEEQKALLWTCLGISAGIGISDYLIRLFKKNSRKKIQVENSKRVYIKPVALEDDEPIPPLPEKASLDKEDE